MELSKEQLMDMLKQAINEIERFYEGEYSLSEEYRPKGMSMKDYDQLFGMNRIENLKEEIESAKKRIERYKNLNDQKRIGVWEKEKIKCEQELETIFKIYEVR